MAGSNAVWGIDIGQCSLKAIRCRQGDTPDRLVAEAFDHIAYPKILSQPGSDPAELIGDALRQFLSRNTVRGDRVAIAVPGQNGLARFIKLPPVESKKIPDIVRYEARQQIPFDLADVIWDYQRMGGGAEEEGFALETEVGLFAMKRDQVHRALEPFTQAGIEVDVVQLTPLALYNFLLFDQLGELPPADQYDPDDPPPSTVILSLGTDATDLVITNGYRVWQRSIPLGGNHFTKALTKELKLTFAKAEHLKCNAASAPDPRALFQAMRPVFNDLLTEIQRSIGYFTSIDRRAKIEKIVALGNAMKMPGLRRYLSQSLGFEVIRLEAFEQLEGSDVVAAPAFKENLLSFGVAYGLTVQALGAGRGTLTTNLLPPEIIKDRFVRGKKPWALAAAALLLLGCAIGYGSHSLALGTVAESRFKTAESQMQDVIQKSQQLKNDASAAEEAFKRARDTGEHLVGNVDNRILWLELLHAVTECLPPGDPPGQRPKNVNQWKEIHIESLECQHLDDLSAWCATIKDSYRPPAKEETPAPAEGQAVVEGQPAATGVPAADPAAPAAPAAPGTPAADPAYGAPATQTADAAPSLQGEGWVIRLTGYHYHNPGTKDVEGAQYVRETLIKKLEENEIFLPALKEEGATDVQEGKEKQELVSMKELGIHLPTLTVGDRIRTVDIRDPYADEDESKAKGPAAAGDFLGGPHGPGRPGSLGMNTQDQKTIKVRKFDFVVEFAWQPTPPTRRKENREKAAQGESGSYGQTAEDQM